MTDKATENLWLLREMIRRKLQETRDGCKFKSAWIPQGWACVEIEKFSDDLAKEIDTRADSEAVKVLKALVEIHDRDERGDPDQTATDEGRREAWEEAKQALQQNGE